MSAAGDTLPEVFLSAVAMGEGRPLLHFEGRTYGYGEMREAALRVAGSLGAAGLEPGDRVALYLGNSPTFVALYLGALSAGLVVVPVNTRYREVELGHMLADSGARLLITDAEGAEVVPRVDRPELGAVTLAHELEGDLERVATLAAGDPLAAPVPRTADDLAVIGYTSGTTGRSKGAMLSHRNFLSNSRALTAAWGWTADDHLLLVLPLFHMHGLGVGLHGTLVQASRITLRRAFDAEDVYTTLLHGEPVADGERDVPTMFFGVPTMHGRLLALAKERGERLERLRLLVSGSAPLSAATHAEVERHLGPRILERYGMTETIMNTGNPYDPAVGPRKAGTVGLPFAGVEVRVADESGTPLPTGGTGEIQLRGPNVSRGYWNRPDATAASRTGDGWFRTGDLGFLDDDGYLTINGRAKELIISGGFNVYPREVEEVIAEIPGVREVAVVGLPHDEWGEQVVAALVADPVDVSDERVVQHCRERLAGFKKPRAVYRLEALPRNALGKVQKHRVVEALVQRGGG